MKKAGLVLIIIFFCSKAIDAQNGLECNIQFYDDVMIGQPMYFEVVLTNKSRRKTEVYYDALGSNHNNLKRDESFEIEISNSNNEQIPIKESIQDELIFRSRRVGFQELQRGDTILYKHWINRWVDIDKPGEYQIQCSKTFKVYEDYTKIKTVTCSSTFEVIDTNSIQLLKKIDLIWSEYSIAKSYVEKLNSIELLCELNTVKTIPYLKEIIDSSYNIPFIKLAMRGLSKFRTNQKAFDIVINAFEDEDSVRFSKVVTTMDLLPSTLGGIKHWAIHCIADFDNSLALPYLYKHRKDSNSSVRLFIMQELARRKFEDVFQVINENISDKDATIRNEANMLMDLMKND